MAEASILNEHTPEWEELMKFLQQEWRFGLDEMADHIEMMQGIMKLDGYMTDGPGFCGTVYYITWSGAPEFVTVVGRGSNPKFDDVGQLRMIGNLGHCGCHQNEVYDEISGGGNG